MNILGRHVLFWRKPGVEVSRFATVLPRLRAIREERDWQPLSGASAVEQRRERVQEARRRIIYHPIPYDRSMEWRLPLRRTWWLWLAGGIAVLSVAALILDFSRGGLERPPCLQLPTAGRATVSVRRPCFGLGEEIARRSHQRRIQLDAGRPPQQHSQFGARWNPRYVFNARSRD